MHQDLKIDLDNWDTEYEDDEQIENPNINIRITDEKKVTELLVMPEIFQIDSNKYSLAGVFYINILFSPKKLLKEYLLDEGDLYKSYTYNYYNVITIDDLTDMIYCGKPKPKKLTTNVIKNTLRELQNKGILQFYKYTHIQGLAPIDLDDVGKKQKVYVKHLLQEKMNESRQEKKQIFFKVYYDDIQRILILKTKRNALRIHNIVNTYMVLCSYMGQSSVVYPSITDIGVILGKPVSSVSDYIGILKSLNIIYSVSGGSYSKPGTVRTFNNFYVLTRVENYEKKVQDRYFRLMQGMKMSGWKHIVSMKDRKSMKWFNDMKDSGKKNKIWGEKDTTTAPANIN